MALGPDRIRTQVVALPQFFLAPVLAGRRERQAILAASQALRRDVARANPVHDMTRLLLPAAGLALTLLLPGTLLARQDASAPASPAPAPAAAPATALAGNPQTGKSLSYTCQGCHGVIGYKNAYPNFHVPRIGGQSAAYLSQALHEYRDGKRKHPTMQAQAQSFTDQDIADLAAYLATVK